MVSRKSTTVNDNSKFKDSSIITTVVDCGMSSEPKGVAVDTAGNIYISDGNNSCILKSKESTIPLITIAGKDRGFAGDGGPATAAEFWFTEGIALDGSGNLFIVDYDNNRIRKMNLSTGIITTVAGNSPLHEFGDYYGDGGPATLAKFNHPLSVAIDSRGNIYIADQFNQRVRRVAASTGIINTIAGNGKDGYSGDGGQATAAELNDPRSVALDAQGNIYIVEDMNNCIRKVTVATGIITTVAGNGQSGYSGDGSQATAAELDRPSGVVIDTNGDMYISEWGNSCIRKVTKSTGIINTIAGGGAIGYLGDGGLARLASIRNPNGLTMDKKGNLYVADACNERIRKITLDRSK